MPYLHALSWNISADTRKHLRSYLYTEAPNEGVLKNKLFLNLRKIHRKTPVLKSLFNKVTDLMACNFIKMRLQHRCFPVKFAKFLRTLILKNICKRLFLCKEIIKYRIQTLPPSPTYQKGDDVKALINQPHQNTWSI